MTNEIRRGEIQVAAARAFEAAVSIPESHAGRTLARSPLTLATPCAAPLMAVIGGFLALHRWNFGLAALALLSVFVAISVMRSYAWMEGLSIMVGVSVYCALACLVWTLAGELQGANVAAFLASLLMAFLSLTTWVCSLHLERQGAWAARGITGITLAVAIVVLVGL